MSKEFDEILESLKQDLYLRAYEIGATVKKFEREHVVSKSVEAQTKWVDFYEANIKYCDLISDAFKDGYFDLPKKEREQ